MTVLDGESAMRMVRRVLAADFACEERCFDEEGVSISPAREMAGRRRILFREKSLRAVTMGTGTVVTCSDDRLLWAKENLGGLTGNQVFAPATLARMGELVAGDGQQMEDVLASVVTPERFRTAAAPETIEISIVHEDGIDELHETKGFANALNYTPGPACPDMAAAVARHEGRVVGIAGVSADSDEMWQVGIDVITEYRVRGIGKALVGRATELVFALGKLPYYVTGPANVPSQRLALALGYRPTWTEAYAHEPRR